MQHECKITVIDKKCFTDYQEQSDLIPSDVTKSFMSVSETEWQV
jgi:hypothetical protein